MPKINDTMLRELPDKQAETYAFIISFFKEFHQIPTRACIANEFGIYPNAAQLRVEALIDKGYLKRVDDTERLMFGKLSVHLKEIDNA